MQIYLASLGAFQNIDTTQRPPLADWKNYATLRYRCNSPREPSPGVFPTLCDYGEMHAPLPTPLAVDKDGNYITRRKIVDLGYGNLQLLHPSQPPPSNAYVQAGVHSMLVVAIVANVGSVVVLAFPKTVSKLQALCAKLLAMCASFGCTAMRTIGNSLGQSMRFLRIRACRCFYGGPGRVDS